MLKELHISNFAIIDDLILPFYKGFNVITGETGAGKSIIIDALSMIMGDKVSADVIRSGKSEAEVRAVFDAKNISQQILEDLEAKGFEVTNHLALRRSVSEANRSRAYINEKPVSLSVLKTLSPYLFEVASQHEHQRLLSEDTHIEFIDQYGELDGLKEEYKEEYNRYAILKNRLNELNQLVITKAEQKEFLCFQVQEIDAQNLRDGEDEELEKERNVVKHSAKLLQNVRDAVNILDSSESSIGSSLSTVNSSLKSAAEIDSGISDWIELCSEAEVAVSELSINLSRYLDKLDIDPSRLDEIESRLYEIKRLKRKYGNSIEDILLKRDELSSKLELLDNCDAEIERVEKELKIVHADLVKVANRLSKKRGDASLRLSEEVQKELITLGLKKTTFVPSHVKLSIEEGDETGIDRINFLISLNFGEPVKPLVRIASGGELSRVMLAIKRILMTKVGLACLEVFDEVDVGIGGAIAEVVGKKLKEMSYERQLICITHLPQVASLGDHHIVVIKAEEKGRAVTRFRLLNNDDRIEEVSRMLGGIKITDATRQYAREMVKRGEV